MKKVLALLTMLALLLAPMAALAAEGDAAIARGEEYSVMSAVPMGDTLVLVSYDKLYTYHIGDTDVKAYELQNAVPMDVESSFLSSNGIYYADDSGLHVLTAIIESDGEHSTIQSGCICDVNFNDDGTATQTLAREVEWPEEMTEESGADTYMNVLQNAVYSGGALYGSLYGGSGDEMWALDLETMKMQRIEIGGDGYGMFSAYPDGRVFIAYNNYGVSGIQLLTYSVADGSAQKLGEVDSSLNAQGYAADAETGEIYAVSNGEICPLVLDGGKAAVGEGVNDMPIDVYSNQPGMIWQGQYYVYCSYQATVIRNLHPTTQADVRLKVVDSSWLDATTDANFAYTNAHGNTSISVSHDYNELDKVVENMMNRAPDVDVYIVDMGYSSYNALKERGFMAELDGSEKLTQRVAKMYPAIQESVQRDGRLVALPVDLSASCLGVNEKALEKLGLTLEDVPANWSDFLDFLINDLPGRWPSDGSVTFTYDGMDVENARWQLFYMIFEEYQNYVNATMDVPSYNTELLRSLMDKLDRVDFQALGLEEASDDESVGGFSFGGDDGGTQLFEMGVNANLGPYYTTSTPVLMSMDAGTEPVFAVRLSVAFVNPFSEHVDDAIAFLETLADCVDESVWYNFDPDLNEPIANRYGEENLKNAQEYLANAQKRYDEAADADRQMLEEDLKSAQRWVEQAEEDRWQVSQAKIDWYRAAAEHLAVAQGNWLYQDSSGEASELMQQYLNHQIDAGKFLEGVDKKVRMMQMEGY